MVNWRLVPILFFKTTMLKRIKQVSRKTWSMDHQFETFGLVGILQSLFICQKLLVEMYT